MPPDLVAPATSREGWKFSAALKLSAWSRRRTSTPNGTQRAVLRPTRPSPSPGPNATILGPNPLPAPAPSPLGLRTVHQPTTAPVADIIFIHGLGGGSERTWSKDPRDPTLFWPQHWLPSDTEIGRARILSFGYNANFLPGSSKSIYNIGDFSKALLNEMRFGKDGHGEDLDIGRVPIIFVVHSMGGLVAKKAYLLGQNDDIYQHIIRSISAMVFLGTPHRGTNLAGVLNRLLTVSLQSSRGFIADLNKSSPALEELNEQFRHIAPKLSIWSFYETLATSVGLMKVQVLDKDSSILGYPCEISRPLDADHHGMSKYSSSQDSNYISVRNALSSLVKQFRLRAVGQMPAEMKDLERILGTSSGPAEDLSFVRDQWIPGTCDWVLQEPGIQSWLESKQESRVSWFCAPPATGKSTLSAHIINYLRDSGALCQYFFFKFADPERRSMSAFLRSLAHQMASDVPTFKRSVLDLSAEGINLANIDARIIWKKLFESIIFATDCSVPLYWVVDALDESESPKILLDLLPSIINSKTPLRILIVSDKTEVLSIAFNRLSSSLPIDIIDKSGLEFNSADIHTFVGQEIKHLRGSDEFKQRIAQNVERRSQGNFLWTRLVLDDIAACHSEDAIQEALNDIPSDMENLYRRMEQMILNNPRKANIALAKALIQWTICSRRLLSLKELSEALRPEFPEILDIKRTIQDLCGQFITVNTTDQVTIVHQTARNYLIQNPSNDRLIQPGEAHEELFTKSVSVLCDPNLRLKLTHGNLALYSTESFVFYAATSWMYHLQNTRAASEETMNKIVKFLKNASVLTWIHALALVGKVELLLKAAKVLTDIVSKRRVLNSTENPASRHVDIDLLERWATDLVKVVGKFSRQLLSDPLAVYKLIPPLCPEESVLHRQFYQPNSAKVVITRISNTLWNDNLAKINLPNGDRAWNVACAAQYIAILGSTSVYIWDCTNFSEICTLRHQEPVMVCCLNDRGNKVVTCGLRNTKLWSVPSGRLLSCIPNPADTRAMAISFADNDARIMVGSDDNTIRYLHMTDLASGWQPMNSSLLTENPQVTGTVVNSPKCIAFSGDGSQVGVSYRGFPLSVWALNEGYCIGRCTRAYALRNIPAHPSTSWFAVDRFTWNPVSGHIIGLYKDGSVFKWHPVTDEYQEAQSAADEIAASADGKLFATSNSDGTVRIWNFSYFTVIYQLSSDDLVTGLAFSPDCRRFYDLRGCTVNAWEPNSLIRFSENEDSFRDTAGEEQSATAVSRTSEAKLVQYEATTVVAAAPGGAWYCVGNEEGVVTIFDTQVGNPVEFFKFSNFLEVSHITWSQDARHVAAADLGGDVVVKCLVTVDGKTELRSLATPKVDLNERGIQQMLFNSDSTLLLIISEDQGQIWSLNDESVTATLEFDHDMNRKWLQHPTRASTFLGFGATDMRLFRWNSFLEERRLCFEEDRLQCESHTALDSKEDHALDLAQASAETDSQNSSSIVVNKAIITQDGGHVLVQTRSSSSQGRIAKQVLIFDISSFAPDGEHNVTQKSLPFAYISPDVLSRIEIPLGIISGSRLAFLDQDLWLCTFKLNHAQDQDEELQRHYFVPRDWASTEGIEQCCMLQDGSLLCPKDDKVAVIRCNLDGTGF